jgi:hypothetical protein
MADWHDFSVCFPEGGFLPRIGVRDGRALEQALAGESLWDAGRRPISGAVVEATYAATGPGVLKTLNERHVPFLVDPQTLRFGSPTFQEVGRMSALAYAPRGALHPGTEVDEVVRMVRGAIDAQAEFGAAALFTPVLPLHDDSLEQRLELFTTIVRETVRYVGRAGGARRPVVAVIPSAHGLLNAPERLADVVGDVAVSAFYVQPLRLLPTRDSVEKLVAYLRLVEHLASFGLPIIAGRVGAFGLLLPGVGADFCEAGLGESEQFDLASLTRSRKPRDEATKSARGSRRVYFEALKTTFTGRDAEAMLGLQSVRARLACGLQCCRFRGFDELLSRSREHYMFTRSHEMAEVLGERTRELKLERIHRDVRTAQENARAIRRAFQADRQEWTPPEHLDRWLSVLARLTSVPAAAGRF